MVRLTLALASLSLALAAQGEPSAGGTDLEGPCSCRSQPGSSQSQCCHSPLLTNCLLDHLQGGFWGRAAPGSHLLVSLQELPVIMKIFADDYLKMS